MCVCGRGLEGLGVSMEWITRGGGGREGGAKKMGLALFTKALGY